MIDINAIREICGGLENVSEEPHFEKTSWRVQINATPKSKPSTRIFATYDFANNRLCLLLTPDDQSLLCSSRGGEFSPVPNKWGEQGATFVELDSAKLSDVRDGISRAYQSKRSQSKPNQPT